ncbi:MAG TPA: thioredoxin domain-containing protein [Candidatus Saccharimonadales bacterium]|nr:thioredoxin domain-containing protein [Candidatus Saccharimonadales bacterium]
MDRRFVGILAAIVIIFIVIFAITQGGNSKSSGGNNSGAQPTSHTEGKGTTGVKLVEYGDYECPICGEYYPVVNQVAQKYSNQIVFQFRNLPLIQIHPNAFAAARAAEAAGLQDKYWQMHDKLYTNQSQWANSSNPKTFFDTYAQQIGLNVNQFNSDYGSGKVNDAINADLSTFDKTGQPMATPTFFLNGKYIDNTQFSDPQTGQPSVDKFSNVLDAAIAKKNT